jgi:hypothetical protein
VLRAFRGKHDPKAVAIIASYVEKEKDATLRGEAARTLGRLLPAGRAVRRLVVDAAIRTRSAVLQGRQLGRTPAVAALFALG